MLQLYSDIFQELWSLFKYLLCSLVVGDLRSETKGSWLESSCQLCAEVSPPQQSPGQYLSTRKAGGSGREELNRYPPLPLLPRES